MRIPTWYVSRSTQHCTLSGSVNQVPDELVVVTVECSLCRVALAAFDTVLHSRLLVKLVQLGITGKLLK